MANFYYYYLSVLFLVFLMKHLYNRNKKKLPPSPFALPIIGHLYIIKSYLDHLTLTSLISRYVPILFLRLGFRSFLVVSSPSLVKECYTKNDMSFIERPKCMASDIFTYNYTLVGWAPYTRLWKIIRRLFAEQVFSTSSIQKSATIREEETQTLVRLLLKASESGFQKVNLDYLIFIFVSNNSMRLVAGKCYVKEMDAGTETGKNKIEKFRSLFTLSLLLNVCDYLPFLKLFGYKGIEKKLISWQERRNDFIEGTIDDIRQQITYIDTTTNSMKKEKKTTLVETLLSLQETNPDFYTNYVIKSFVLVMFMTVTHPTSKAIESAMSLLITHPNELHMLRTEIDNVVGTDRLLNESDLDKLPYLHCVINETLRLYPPLPVLQPHCSTEDCVVGGYDIPKGTVLVVNSWGMHRDNKVWEEPNKFKPERFIQISDHSLNYGKEGFKFVPFGMGRRGCPGEDMGLRMILLALGALVQCFDWKMGGEKDMKSDNFAIVTVGKDKPLEAICISRQLQLLSQI